MKIVSFSLFGDAEKYRQGLLDNIDKSRKVFRDWQFVVHCDRRNFELLSALNLPSHVELICPQEISRGVEGMSWRFLPTTLRRGSTVIFRDTDSILTAREEKVVTEWLASRFQVHLMRDHPFHQSLIMGGMFGVRGDALRLLEKLSAQRAPNSRLTEYGDDQVFLSSQFYPLIQAHSLLHTDCVKFWGEYSLPMPPMGAGEQFIGAYAYLTPAEADEYEATRANTPPRTFLPASWKNKRVLKSIYKRHPYRLGITHRCRWCP